MSYGRRRSLLFAAAVAATMAIESPVRGQNQFGGQDRADAVTRLIVLGIERARDSLPLVSGQSVTYEFDPSSDAFGRKTRLGPSVLRSSQTIPAGQLAVHMAVSYFELGDTFAPINYLFTHDDGSQPPIVAKIGLDAGARVGTVDTSVTYGLTSRIEVGASIPISVVDAYGSQVYSTVATTLSVPAAQSLISGAEVIDGNLAGAIRGLDALLATGRPLALRTERLTALAFDYHEGTQPGLGRIALRGKGTFLSLAGLQLAGAGELFLPSPNEDDFAGPASVAIASQLIASYKLADRFRLHSDIGYSYDFDHAELRHFSWSLGGSVALSGLSADIGIGGSELDSAIEWTPRVVHGVSSNPNESRDRVTGLALQSTTTGTQMINILLGGKLKIGNGLAVVCGVTVPVVTPAFQPDVLGTLALEGTF